mmetsp:Transcript_73870/g.139594  ORF Transcript_73870/g.139594 Transcript_73870/m.139594 type:complete len:209 (-) Transcript_73870:343-969(-)
MRKVDSIEQKFDGGNGGLGLSPPPAWCQGYPAWAAITVAVLLSAIATATATTAAVVVSAAATNTPLLRPFCISTEAVVHFFRHLLPGDTLFFFVKSIEIHLLLLLLAIALALRRYSLLLRRRRRRTHFHPQQTPEQRTHHLLHAHTPVVVALSVALKQRHPLLCLRAVRRTRPPSPHHARHRFHRRGRGRGSRRRGRGYGVGSVAGCA